MGHQLTGFYIADHIQDVVALMPLFRQDHIPLNLIGNPPLGYSLLLNLILSIR